MSSSENEDWECPLCMEEMDIDDRGFFPCECGYQICRFCHNRISEDYGGRCPACRRLYSEQTPKWKPISPAQVAKLKNDKKAKEREKREIESNSRRHLANVRVVQKNLVYVIGLPSNLSTEETLRSHDYFGQFGRINKIVVNRRQAGGSSHHPTVGVYVTYATKEEATRAINAVDGSMLEGRVLRATFGTTKYCSYYLRNIPCQNPGCMYLHEPGEEADSFTKEDLAANRVGLRDGNEYDYDHEDDDHHHHSGHQHHRSNNRASNISPGANVASGRVQAAPASSISGFQNGRSHTAAPSSAASSSAASHQHHPAPASVSRVRKSSEISSIRPRSVDPPGADHDSHNTGSALPATASWASRAMAKKPAAEAADSRPRKSDSGSGTMTLRMIPSSRGKSATVVPVARASTSASASSVAGAASAAGAGASATLSTSSASASGGASRDRSKSNAVLETATSASAGAGSASNASGPCLSASASQSQQQQQHHPVLQQMSRERKQQLRHQTRAQQKAAESAAESSGGMASEAKAESASKQAAKKAAPALQPQNEQSSKKTQSLSAGSVSHPEAETAAASATAELLAADNDGANQSTDAEAPIGDTQPQDINVLKEQVHTLSKTENVLSDENDATEIADAATRSSEADSAAAAATKVDMDSGGDSKSVLVDSPSVSHANSAISFQNITDSLFAQLNAKVSTPANTSLPSFSASGAAFDNHPPGLRPTSGYPISGVDPLLFPPSISTDNTMAGAYGSVGGSLNSASPFSLLGGGQLHQQQQQQQNSGIAATGQWSGLAATTSQISQSPLSVLLGEPASGGAPFNGAAPRDSNAPLGFGLASRQRSRWDFVQPDEASAQAELQSVLGRSGMVSSSILGLGSQYGPGVPALNSSRDLGLFATPIQNDYALGGPWGLGSGQGSESASTAPLPPPGFGSRKNTETSLQAESRSRSPLVSGATPLASAGPNTLLSRLIGQSASDLGGISAAYSGDNSAQQTSLSPSLLSQPQQFQDPAILSSYMAAAVAAVSPQQQQQQQPTLQAQGGRGRADPNVLNSLLARLHLGQADSDSPLSSISTPQGSGISNQAFGSGSILGGLHTQPDQQQQQAGPIMPPGIIPMGTSGSATSPVYGAGNAGMHMNTDALRAGELEKYQVLSMNSEFLADRSRQRFQQLKQQQQQQLELQKQQYLQQLHMQQQQQQDSAMLSSMAPRMLQGSLPGQPLDAGAYAAIGAVSPSSGGFVDPAIMNMGRMQAVSNAMGGGAPGTLVGPPPGIQSPSMGEAASNAQTSQSKMPSRSANSSGRSRFLNHFSADAVSGSSSDNQHPEDVRRADSGSEHEAGAGGDGSRRGMVNGVPPGLPTTGLFGELLRRSKLDAAAAGSGASAIGSPMTLPVADGEANSRAANGRMMLSDIERKLDAARREAQELQAQLSTVIGQNQSAMWALANGGSMSASPSAGGDAAASHAGVSYSAGNV
ncbi:transcriptional repressor general negative regulator of transcription subunit 4 [Coemansia sp. RSA 1722]|nr:transcriptional repressor general negative regulator of transcription subunit 4 [Coemansia sp. RSA 485]KAJ2598913.1 transcriptional repressor general negative regulator of transcription subunit 4 [Coemansia sp. RSA 1721]KAJ2603692.1 transcriptional repressor general negative regulator of transcription subunit 4 [Coemansia sp. RSA 1722]